jgi:hypothetical protein
MDPRLERLADDLHAGRLGALSAPLDDAQLERDLKSLEEALSQPPPSDYLRFVKHTSGRGVRDPLHDLFIYSLKDELSLVSGGHAVLESGQARGIVIGSVGHFGVVLRLQPSDPTARLCLSRLPVGFVEPSSIVQWRATYPQEGPSSHLLEYLQHWSEDNSWTRVGWGF